MKEFKSIQDVERARLPDGLAEAVRAAIGGYTPRDALFEGAECGQGCSLTSVLFTNPFGVSIGAPDIPVAEKEERLLLDCPVVWTGGGPRGLKTTHK